MLASKLVFRALAALALSMAVCAPLRAHRLDEYLQAIRVDVERTQITLEIDLTPGSGNAKSVLAAIDIDRDATISETEAEAYARRVLNELHVTIDGAERSLVLAHAESPGYADIEEGIGVIRLTATMSVAPEEGRHRLVVRNDHRPEGAIYLANALMPVNREVTIASQVRDPLQRSLSIEYTVAPPMSAIESTCLTIFTLVLFCGLVWCRR